MTPFINDLAATIFGIYLIYDNIIAETAIWLKWLHLSTLMNDKWYVSITNSIDCLSNYFL